MSINKWSKKYVMALFFLFVCQNFVVANQNLVAKHSNIFMLKLYKFVAENTDENIIFSPFSIINALSMVLMGSKGKTEHQIKWAFNFTGDKNDLAESFKSSLCSFEGKKKYTLDIANMLFVSENYPILEEFNRMLVENFLSTMNLRNFSDSENVRKEINEAVEEETNSKIEDLLPSDAIDPSTVMVLVNAIYFKGDWDQPFSHESTYTETFWVKGETAVDVSMMHIEESFFYIESEELDGKILRMDYKGGRMSMYILLPKEKKGFHSLEEKLSLAVFEKNIKDMPKKKVNVLLPKYKLEESIDLIPLLKEMGIKDLFSENDADLSCMTSSNNLYVSTAVHKAFIEVNEQGAEAAAATGFVLVPRTLPIDPEEFYVDHPFIFMIRDNEQDLVLFAGRVTDPTN